MRRRIILANLVLVLAAFVLLAWADTATQDPTTFDASHGTWDSTAVGNVNDHPDSSCTTKNTCTALGAAPAECQLTYTHSALSLPAGSTSISVAVLYFDQKGGSPTATVAARLKVGGSYFNAATHNPSATCTTRSDTFATNPKTTAAWTVAEINQTDGTNDLQGQGVMSTDTTPNISVASLRVQVTYTPPSSGRRGQTIVTSTLPPGWISSPTLRLWRTR